MSRIQGRSVDPRRSPSSAFGGGRCCTKSFFSGSGASQVTVKLRGPRRSRRSPGLRSRGSTGRWRGSGSADSASAGSGAVRSGWAAGPCASAEAQTAQPNIRTNGRASLMGSSSTWPRAAGFRLQPVDAFLQPLDRVTQLRYLAHVILYLHARGDEGRFFRPVLGSALGGPAARIPRPAGEAPRAFGEPVGGDVAHDPGQVFLEVPAEMAREERDLVGELHVPFHLDLPVRGLVVRGEPRQQEGRQAHLEIAGRAREGRGDLARGLDGEGERHGSDVEYGGAPRVLAQPLHGHRRRAQYMIQRGRGGVGKHRSQTFHPRCRATTPAARLKYSTRVSPAVSIIDLSSTWSGCMRIDSAR